MGKTDIYGARRPVIATLKIDTVTIPYGFLTNVDTTESGQLGLTEVTAGTFSIIGANLPKPTRMIKKNGGYSVSSFVSTANIATAFTSNWKIQKVGKRYFHSAGNVATGTLGSVKVFVNTTVSGITFKYAWKMPRIQAQKIFPGAAGSLGITLPTNDTDAKDMMFGVNNVKPSRASQAVGATGESSSYVVSTFYEAGKTLPAGWMHVSGIKVTGSKPEF